MPRDISALSPQEKDQLLMQLMDRFDSEGSGGPAEEAAGEPGPEPEDDGGAPDGDKLAFLARALVMIAERVDLLEKTQMEFVGGLRDTYNDHQKSIGIDEISKKYGDLFSPVADSFKHMFPEGDIPSELYKMREGMRGQDGYTDEGFDAKVQEIAKQMIERFSKMPGVKAVAVKAEAPVAEAKEKVAEEKKDEKEKAAEPAKEGGGKESMSDYAARMKKAGVRL